MARTSDAAQAAAEGLGAPLDGTIDSDADEDGVADGAGLGLGLLLQAPESRIPDRARIAIGEIRGRTACAIVGLIKRPQHYGFGTMLPRAGG